MTSPLNSTFNRRPAFTWNAVSGATKYEVQVRNVTTGATVYNQKNLTTTNWTPPANLPDGPYRWWVIAVNSDARKRFIAAYERRLSQEVTHPIFGYRISYRRILEVQARLLGRFLTGEIFEFPQFVTR